MASDKKIISGIAQTLELKYKPDKIMAHGVYRGYDVIARIETVNSKRRVKLSFSVCKDSAPNNPMDFSGMGLAQEIHCEYGRYRVTLDFVMMGNNEKNINLAVDTVVSIVNFFALNGFVNCDDEGVVGNGDIYIIKGEYAFLCEESLTTVKNNLDNEKYMHDQIQENYALGIVGAVIGGIAGAVLILLLARLGRVSIYVNALMAFLVVWGYKKLGKKISVVGIIICSVISLAMLYGTFRLDAAIDMYKAVSEAHWHVDFIDCLKNPRGFYESLGATEAVSAYIKNFLLMMIFGIIGIVITIAVTLSEKKESYSISKLD